MKEDFPKIELRNLCKIARGGSPRPIKNFITHEPDGINWIKIGDAEQGGRYIDSTAQRIKPDGISRSRFVEAGSFLLSNSMSFGRPYILRISGCIHDGWLVLEPDYERVSQDFLYHALSSQAVFDQFNSLAAGSTVRNLNIDLVKGVQIPLPPLEEQQRIVAVLDEAFKGLTRAREHAEANVQNARELSESYLLSVFDQRGWQHQTLNQISENLDRLRVPITKSKRVPGEIPYYGASGVVDQVADYIFDEDLLLVSEDGANLLARTYPIAFSITGKSWVNNHAHVLRFETVSDQEFVSLYLNSISIEPYVSGMAQPKLNQKQLNRIPIPYPDRTTRKQIVIRAQEITQKTQQLRTIFEADLKAFDDLRQSLLQRAFTGELT